MNLAIFVHDYRLEVGHSNALIEVINNFPSTQIDSIQVFSYTCSSFEEIHPDFAGKCEWIRTPFPKIYPTLLKIVFYHLYSWLQSKVYLKKDSLKIGIGIASLEVDVSYVQFIHEQWKDYYLESQKYSWKRYLYKKLMYRYLSLCEKFFFSRRDLKVVTLASFMEEYLVSSFEMEKSHIATVYSGVNLERFSYPKKDKYFYYEELKNKYPEVEGLDLNKVVFLFVGAYERKGLQKVLDSLSEIVSPQILIVGDHEVGTNISFPSSVKTFRVKYTKEVDKFYAIADCFLFPTIYEPFGLVILEAASMGLQVMVTSENVGASEIIKGMKEVYLFKQNEKIPIEHARILSLEDKKTIVEERSARLNDFKWKNSSEKFYHFIRKGN